MGSPPSHAQSKIDDDIAKASRLSRELQQCDGKENTVPVILGRTLKRCGGIEWMNWLESDIEEYAESVQPSSLDKLNVILATLERLGFTRADSLPQSSNARTASENIMHLNERAEVAGTQSGSHFIQECESRYRYRLSKTAPVDASLSFAQRHALLRMEHDELRSDRLQITAAKFNQMEAREELRHLKALAKSKSTKKGAEAPQVENDEAHTPENQGADSKPEDATMAPSFRTGLHYADFLDREDAKADAPRVADEDFNWSGTSILHRSASSSAGPLASEGPSIHTSARFTVPSPSFLALWCHVRQPARFERIGPRLAWLEDLHLSATVRHFQADAGRGGVCRWPHYWLAMPAEEKRVEDALKREEDRKRAKFLLELMETRVIKISNAGKVSWPC
ncbi:hypothetical protein BJ742DRAFT_745361 [Cladochytrium replicatum]|nr:hypothetical protein BJ742DRAFT_745361 [Cladochytrium replicatum]